MQNEQTPRRKATCFHARGSALALAVLMTLAIAILAACGGTETEESEQDDGIPAGEELTIRVGTIASVPLYWAIYGAEDLGYTSEEGVRLDIITLDEPRCLRALVGGSVDACPTGLDSAIRVAQAGADVKAVATVADPSVNTLNVDPSIKAWEDLKGKVIASQTPDAGSSVAIRALLAAHGLDPFEDVEFLTVGGTSDRYAALVAGEVEAAITSQPQDFIGQDEGFPIIGDSTEGKPQAVFLGAIPGSSEEVDEALQRLIRAMERAQDWISDPANRQEATDRIAELFEMEKKYAAQTYDSFKEVGAWDQGTAISMDSIKRVMELTDTYTSTKVTVAPEDMVDDRFLP